MKSSSMYLREPRNPSQDEVAIVSVASGGECKHSRIASAATPSTTQHPGSQAPQARPGTPRHPNTTKNLHIWQRVQKTYCKPPGGPWKRGH
jgi:hypothetical protein